MLSWTHAPIFIRGFNHQLGRLWRDLNELKAGRPIVTVEIPL
jgi:hypothetical protein